MIKITICDDERVESVYLTELVREWARERQLAVQLSDYESAENFLFDCGDDMSADVLLLDIQMKGMDGVELARRIRRDNSSVQIIFVTGYADFIADGYDVSALHYLMKPVKADKLFEVLDRAVQRLSMRGSMIGLPVDGGIARIFADDIVYIEAFNHVLEINTTGEKHTVKMPLRELEGKLTDNFVHCHRSCIVNMRYVKKITRTEITLDSGQTLPLSRRLYAVVNKAMIKIITGGDGE